MEQNTEKRKIKRILDALLILIGIGLVALFLWNIKGHQFLYLPLVIVILCVLWAIQDLINFTPKREVADEIGRAQKLVLLDESGKPIKSWDMQGRTSMIIGKKGQGEEPDVDLAECEYSSFIDFQHAALNFCLDQWYVEDLESQNGVKVKKVEDGECYRIIHRPCKVTIGDVIYIASTRLLLT